MVAGQDKETRQLRVSKKKLTSDVILLTVGNRNAYFFSACR